jgi:phosphohistidine phosphatase
MLYLIRHADALDLENDELRPLSARGRDQVRALGRFFCANDAFRPDEIWHSRLLRARETAQLLVAYVKLAVPVVETTALEPESSPRVIAEKLRQADRSIAIVGHNPHLEFLASLLVQRVEQPAAFVMKKGAALALRPDDERWIVQWHVSPDLLP